MLAASATLASCLALGSPSCGPASAAGPTAPEAGARIDAFARSALREIGTTPGLAVTVVQGERVIYTGQFGFRDLEARAPVTPETRFYLASSTKAFTALLAATLAEEGKVDLDAPVAGAWPELQLTAPLSPGQLSLRDLLAMRSGLGNDTANFRMEIGNLRDEAELLRVLATYSRQDPRTFRYSNLNYVLAGRVLEKATGTPWPALVEERLLRPLEMGSTLTAPPPPGSPDMAKTYSYRGPDAFALTPVELGPLVGPAGSMVTTTGDAARWLIALVNDGRVGGRQVIPARAVRHVQAPQTTNRRRFRYIDRFAWGLGQDLGDYEGELLVHRFGGLFGAYSHVSFLPEHGIGVAAFANGGGGVPDAVAAFVYDLLLGREGLDAKWSEQLARARATVAEDRAERATAEAATAAARRPPGREPGQYAGTYHYDRLGDVEVTATDGRLYGQLGAFRAELVPTGGDDFLVDWIDSGEAAPIRFVIDDGGGARIDWGGRIFERVR